MTYILTFLGSNDLASMSLVSMDFYRLIRSSDAIWRSFAANVYPLWYSTAHLIQKPVVENTSAWRQLLSERVDADRLWRTPEREMHHKVKSCPRGVHAVYFDDRSLLLGSGLFNEVVSYDLRSGTKHTGSNGAGMYGHTQAVTCLRPLSHDKTKLLTGSLDGTLRLFNRESMTCGMTLNGHTDKVWCVEEHAGRFFSGSTDKTVRIWCAESGVECATPLQSHRTSISSLRLILNHTTPLLMSGSAGNTIRVWDFGNGGARCVTKLRGHAKGVFCMQCAPGCLMSGSLDNTIKVWDPRQNFRLVHELVEYDHQNRRIVSDANDTDTSTGVITFQCDDTKVVSGGPDKVIKVWDLRMRAIVQRLEGHSHWVTTLQFDSGKIVSGSRDKTLRFWDLNGRLDQTLPLGMFPE